MARRLDTVINQAETLTLRLDAVARRELVDYLQESYARLRQELRLKYPTAVREAAEVGLDTSFRAARARVLIEELNAALTALDPAHGPFERVIREGVTRAHDLGRDAATQLLSVYQADVTLAQGGINLNRVSAIVEGATERLKNHSDEAIRRIKAAIADGVTRGTGVQRVTREVKAALLGDGRTPGAGLFARAETIAITEIGQATEAARKDVYREQGITLVQRFVIQDERTCPVCAPRHGEVTRLDQTLEKLHPRCRDYLAPWKPEWQELGLTRDKEFAQERAEIMAGLTSRGVKIPRGPSVFERAAGLKRPKPVWQPKRIRLPGIIPRVPVERVNAEVAEKARQKVLRKAEVLRVKRARLERIDEKFTNDIQAVLQQQDVIGDQLFNAVDLTEAAEKALRNQMRDAERLVIDLTIKRQTVRRQIHALQLDADRALLKIVLPKRPIMVDGGFANTLQGGTLSTARRGLDTFARMVSGGGQARVPTIKFELNPKARSSYDPRRKVIRFAKAANERTAIHEAGHWLEFNDVGVADKAAAFLERRTAGETAQKLSVVTGDAAYGEDEVAKLDAFLSPYMGKIYKGRGASEIVSMGLEYMAKETERFARDDPEYFRLIYEIMHSERKLK